MHKKYREETQNKHTVLWYIIGTLSAALAIGGVALLLWAAGAIAEAL